jgi:predicted DNA-binding transcriptional regulator YafY
VDQSAEGVPAGTLRGLRWVKSRRSGAQGNCVEMARLPQGYIAVRNSRHPSGPALVFTPAEVTALILGMKEGDFDQFLPQ